MISTSKPKKKTSKGPAIRTMGIGLPETPSDQLSGVDIITRMNVLKPKLHQLKQDNDIMQKEIMEREVKFKKREAEYREIIQELQGQIDLRVEFTENGIEKMGNQRKDLHKKILTNIESIQAKTTNVLAEQEKDIIRFYNTKIKELQSQFEQENAEQGKRNEDFLKKEKKLISDLEWIKDISDKIDSENHVWMRKYMELKIKYEAQENARQVLLNDVVVKKKRNAILYSQLEEYKRLFELLSSQDPKDSQNASQLSKKAPQVDLEKLDHTSQKLDRQKIVLENFQSLLAKEKTRYSRLKRHFETELLRQDSLEAEIKDNLRSFLKSAHLKKDSDLVPLIRKSAIPGNPHRIEVELDPEFYRIRLTKEERKELVSLILSKPSVINLLSSKLIIDDKLKEMEDFEVRK